LTMAALDNLQVPGYHDECLSIFAAAASGEVKECVRLIAEDDSILVDGLDSNGHTAMFYAQLGGHSNVIDLLAARGWSRMPQANLHRGPGGRPIWWEDGAWGHCRQHMYGSLFPHTPVQIVRERTAHSKPKSTRKELKPTRKKANAFVLSTVGPDHPLYGRKVARDALRLRTRKLRGDLNTYDCAELYQVFAMDRWMLRESVTAYVCGSYCSVDRSPHHACPADGHKCGREQSAEIAEIDHSAAVELDLHDTAAWPRLAQEADTVRGGPRSWPAGTAPSTQHSAWCTQTTEEPSELCATAASECEIAEISPPSRACEAERELEWDLMSTDSFGDDEDACWELVLSDELELGERVAPRGPTAELARDGELACVKREKRAASTGVLEMLDCHVEASDDHGLLDGDTRWHQLKEGGALRARGSRSHSVVAVRRREAARLKRQTAKAVQQERM